MRGFKVDIALSCTENKVALTSLGKIVFSLLQLANLEIIFIARMVNNNRNYIYRLWVQVGLRIKIHAKVTRGRKQELCENFGWFVKTLIFYGKKRGHRTSYKYFFKIIVQAKCTLYHTY